MTWLSILPLGVQGSKHVSVRPSIRAADPSTLRLLDSLVVFWVVLWVLMGGWSGFTIWQISDLGETVTTSGDALNSAGTAMESVGSLPVVGERAAELGGEVVVAAADISARGQEITSQLRQLALLLGLSIALMPTTPVAGLYLPLRLDRRREVAELRRLLEFHGRDPVVDRYLAERALRSMSFADIRAISPDPWADLAQGRVEALAEAELSRVGLTQWAGRPRARER